MKFFLFVFFLVFSSQAASTEEEVDTFLKQLDGNFKERKAASKKLYRLPVEFYPYLKKHLESGDLSIEVKLRLSKEKMFPLRAKWLLNNRARWYRENILEAYKKHGQKSSKWDGDVYPVLNLLLDQFKAKSAMSTDYGNKIRKNCSAAMKKGCKDPLIKFYWVMGRWIIIARDMKNFRKTLKGAQTLMINSNYHDYFKFRASLMAGKYNVIRFHGAAKHSEEDKASSGKYFQDALRFLPLMLKDRGLPFKELSTSLALLYEEMRKNGTSEYDAFTGILNPIEAAYGKDSFQYTGIKGLLLLKESMHSGVDGSQEVAIRTLANAWHIDPAELVIAENLLKLALSLDNLEKVSKWYANLTLADPANKNAFDARLEKARLSSNSSATWEYANEIAEGGTLMVTRLDQLFIKLYSRYEKNPARLFKRGATYQNEKVKAILDKGFTNYLNKNPNDEDIKIEYAYYSAFYGYWDQADKLFKRAGQIESYKGELDKRLIKELSDEAENYHVKKIKPASSYYVNYREKVTNAYLQRVREGKYDFAKFYSIENKDVDFKILENLRLHSKYWYDMPEESRNVVSLVQNPCYYFEELISMGNKDPLLKFLWAVNKDQTSIVESSEIFKMANGFFKSKYPNHLKLIAICRGILQLGYQKNKVTNEEKEQVKFLINILPDLLNENRINIMEFNALLRGVKRLKLDHVKLKDSLMEKFKSLQMMDYYHVIEGFYYEISSYDYFGKNWKEAFRLEAIGKAAIKKAWYENPRNAGITFHLLFLSREKHFDFRINLRRSMNEVTNTYKAVKHYLYTAGFSTQYASWNVDFPYVFSKVPLLYCFCVNHHAFRNKKDKDYRSRHWKGVSIEYNRYLEKYPNDSNVRSEYALFAIKCDRAEVAREQLELLGKYANEKIFKGRKKLEEYRKKYLK